MLKKMADEIEINQLSFCEKKEEDENVPIITTSIRRVFYTLFQGFPDEIVLIILSYG